jgi:hypothetical protein
MRVSLLGAERCEDTKPKGVKRMSEQRQDIVIDWDHSLVTFLLNCRCGSSGLAVDFDGRFVECHACQTMYHLPALMYVDRSLGAVPGGELSVVTSPVDTMVESDDVVSI